MEFDDMRKIWDAQNNEVLFAINEEALHNRVKSKKKAANRSVNAAEIGLIIINSLLTIYLIFDAIFNNGDTWDYAEVGIILFSIIYLLFRRFRRMASESRFDRSIIGELNHAINSAKSTLSLSYTLVYGYFLPMGIFVFLHMIYNGASLEKWLIVIFAYALGTFLVAWERKKCHIPRVNHLIALKDKLIREI